MELDDESRGLFTNEKTSKEDLEYPNISGSDEENYDVFRKKLETAFRANHYRFYRFAFEPVHTDF